MKRNEMVLGLRNALLAGCLVFAGLSCAPDSPKTPEPSQPVVTFKPQEMADALHAVIAADREVYARLVIQPFGAAGGTNGSPLMPPHLLRPASESVQAQGAEFHYIARSLWPINPKDTPETPTEKKALEYLLDHANANFYGEESLGGRRYFTAVYPDRAIAPACVTCHNQHPDSPKKDFKVGDIMGGMVVRVPLEF